MNKRKNPYSSCSKSSYHRKKTKIKRKTPRKPLRKPPRKPLRKLQRKPPRNHPRKVSKSKKPTLEKDININITVDFNDCKSDKSVEQSGKYTLEKRSSLPKSENEIGKIAPSEPKESKPKLCDAITDKKKPEEPRTILQQEPECRKRSRPVSKRRKSRFRSRKSKKRKSHKSKCKRKNSKRFRKTKTPRKKPKESGDRLIVPRDTSKKNKNKKQKFLDEKKCSKLNSVADFDKTVDKTKSKNNFNPSNNNETSAISKLDERKPNNKSSQKDPSNLLINSGQETLNKSTTQTKIPDKMADKATNHDSKTDKPVDRGSVQEKSTFCSSNWLKTKNDKPSSKPEEKKTLETSAKEKDNLGKSFNQNTVPDKTTNQTNSPSDKTTNQTNSLSDKSTKTSKKTTNQKQTTEKSNSQNKTPKKSNKSNDALDKSTNQNGNSGKSHNQEEETEKPNKGKDTKNKSTNRNEADKVVKESRNANERPSIPSQGGEESTVSNDPKKPPQDSLNVLKSTASNMLKKISEPCQPNIEMNPFSNSTEINKINNVEKVTIEKSGLKDDNIPKLNFGNQPKSTDFASILKHSTTSSKCSNVLPTTSNTSTNKSQASCPVASFLSNSNESKSKTNNTNTTPSNTNTTPSNTNTTPSNTNTTPSKEQPSDSATTSNIKTTPADSSDMKSNPPKIEFPAKTTTDNPKMESSCPFASQNVQNKIETTIVSEEVKEGAAKTSCQKDAQVTEPQNKDKAKENQADNSKLETPCENPGTATTCEHHPKEQGHCNCFKSGKEVKENQSVFTEHCSKCSKDKSNNNLKNKKKYKGLENKNLFGTPKTKIDKDND